MNELKSLPVTIVGKQYDLDSLSERAREQLASINRVDENVVLIQQKLAIMTTVRNSFAKALEQEVIEKY
jgi:hypothetical protein